MTKFLPWPCIVAIALGSGCQNVNRQQRPPAPPPGTLVPGPPSAAFPGPTPTQPFVPPPSAPGAGFVPPAAPAPVNPGNVSSPPSAPVPGGANYPPSEPARSEWQPAPGSVKLLPPEPTISESAKPTPPKIAESKEPPTATTPPPAFPAGIPQFNPVKDDVANGLKPALEDGLDWLQGRGYRTVLQIRKPGEDDSADRKQVEKRGMRYLSLEVSPETLSRKIVAEFSQIVADKAKHPLFVYDRDGSLAGGLWYLHFRLAEQATDDAARVRAGALGFREDRDDSHRSMWLSVQSLLKGS